jgi:DNA repair exonuclease SbcCD ATPase subunit
MSDTAVLDPSNQANLTAASQADKAARDAAIKQADNFFKADVKEAPKGNPSDLFRKMAEKLNQDTTQFQEKIDAEKEAARSAEINREEAEVKATSIDDEKKPGFIKSLKQTNEQLAREAAELKKKAEDYEKAQQEIAELRSKIEDSESKKEVDKLRKELEQAIKERQEREETLTRDLEETRKANAFLNLPADPIFKETFDAPILNGYNQVKMILGEDQASLTEFGKAVQAYEASLTATDPSERARQRETSKQTLNYIYENLSPMEQAKFNSTAYDVLNKVEARNQAIANWETTKAQADEEKTRRMQATKSQIGKRWQDAFAQAKQQLDDAVKYNEEIAKIIASAKIDDDTTEDELIAEAALRENSNYAPEQITRVLMQGAKFKKAKAYSFALEKENSELKETIKKMRGSGTSDGSIGSSSAGKANAQEERTPEALFAKFRK